jgi:predicted transcriptional regulator
LAGRRRKARAPAKIEELLGPLEAEVMNIMWVRGPSLVSEVEELLNRRRSEPLAYKTYLTICSRLSEKGLLIHRKEGRAFRFSPMMTEGEFVARQAAKAADEMLDRFGHVAISNFVDRVAADPDQLAALRELIEGQEKG